MARQGRDGMSGSAEYVKDSDTVVDAARRLAELNVGALPIWGQDDRLAGILTDRDIVVKVVAAGKDPASTKVAEIADRPPVVTIGAHAVGDETPATMAEPRGRPTATSASW